MKRILYVGTYRQQDSWGRNSRDYIMALLANPDISLTTRPIYYTNIIENNIDPKIIACEHTSYDNYDSIIQHGLISSFHIGNETSKNIGIVNAEFSSGQSVFNSLILNKLDEIYVSTEAEKKAILSLGVTKPIKIIPKPINLDKITIHQTPKIQFPSSIESSFKFYCRSGYDERSNLHLLITAFSLAFNELDRVSLIIAPNADTANPPGNIKNSIEKLAQQIKNNLHSNKVFKNEIIICDYFNDDMIMNIHNSGDCFININSGCNFDEETLIAAYLGKTPLVLQNTGLDSLIGGEKGGYIVRSENYPIVLQKPPLPEIYDLFNANYTWRVPLISSLIETLQKAYYTYKNNRQTYQEKQSFGSQQINKYSYTNIGQQLCN